MTLLQLAIGLSTRFNDQIGNVAVEYDNAPLMKNGVKVNKPTNEPWIRCAVKLGDPAKVQTGGRSLYRRAGVLIAQVFCPLNTGDATGLELAETIVTAFRGYTGMTHARFREPRVENIGRNENEWQINVTCPFEADTFA